VILRKVAGCGMGLEKSGTLEKLMGAHPAAMVVLGMERIKYGKTSSSGILA
jgi:hypothetical protein